LQEAIQNLDTVAIQIVLVVGSGGKFLGTLTDGDIRRGLLNGCRLNEKIEFITNREPLIVKGTISKDVAIGLMIENKIHQIPIIDDDYHLVGLYLWDEIFATKKHENTMVIMAGGRGNRLAPYTDQCPKPLLAVSGKPILQHIIERAKLDGFNHFVLAINYLGHMIKDYFLNGDNLGVKIEYIFESDPLGTAGALSLLKPLPSLPIVVTNGDVITNVSYSDLLQFHVLQKAEATMAVLAHELQHPFGVVKTNGLNIMGFEEKPTIYTQINAGIYVLSPGILAGLQLGIACDMPSIFENAINRSQKTIAYLVNQSWIDVGRAEDLKKIRLELKDSSDNEL
jgi:dTDP-glucose pyrophosphorylase